ncbi:FeoB-associated Cys-rich membrane protein [Pedobacter ureilyticus]|uniref:FeoB-associated Cys-rich membrane protein n=1 Tax=Pedobacter ureilyticus TaxID=1393051 RepID=A0ABW9J612_9SPHI|nr:FeoB-associated Cys-rich membrane protein [Pedobacter helvus]
MDIQFILMIVIFAAALIYVGRIIYRSIAPKKGSCATGCGKCSADFSKIPDTKS